MNQHEFHGFVRAACVRTVSRPGFIGYLRLTRFYRESHAEHKLREPEMCQALIQEAEACGMYYGLEVPTDHVYRFTPLDGEGQRKALHDFVLYGIGETDSRPRVRVELKEGSPSMRRGDEGQIVDVPALSKDLRKLVLEPSVDGRAVIHILQAADEGTLPSLLQKYRLALGVALAEAAQAPEQNGETWFSLLFLVLRRRGQLGANRPALWHIPLDVAVPAGQQVLVAGEPIALLPA